MFLAEPEIFVKLEAAGNETYKSLNLKLPQAPRNRNTAFYSRTK